MSQYKTVTVLGGDRRQAALAAHMAREGLSVSAFGLPQEILAADVQSLAEWQTAVEGAEVVILPLPASPDSKHLNMPLIGEEEHAPRLCEIVDALASNVFLAGGRFTPAVKGLIAARGIKCFDYFESEELQQKNALPTAEGAVSILMREIPQTVSGLPVAITGFGRVSRALTALLLAMGAEVTVAARKTADLKSAAALGCHTVPLIDGEPPLALRVGYAVIFNTVPYRLFDEATLAGMDRSTLIIDLASAPGGVNGAVAAAAGVRVIWALSLPGKYAPVTAGTLIAQTILSHMKKEGML